MKKATLLLLAIVWIAGLIVLIIALTDCCFPDNPFKDHKMVTGIGFIALTAVVGMLWKKTLKVV